MKLERRWEWYHALALACVMMLGGCPESDDTGLQDVLGSGAVDAGLEDVGLEDVTLSEWGSLEGYILDAISTTPIVGASLCIEGEVSACAVSSTDGRVSLEVPAGALTLTVEANGYQPARTRVDSDVTGQITVPLLRSDTWSANAVEVGVNGASGLLALFRTPDEAGTLVPLSGVSLQLTGYVGLGAFHDVTGELQVGSATSSDGLGLFLDVGAGDYTLLASHPDGSCLPTQGTHTGTLEVEVVNGSVSVVVFDCLVVTSSKVMFTGGVTSEQTGEAMANVQVCLHVDARPEPFCTYTDEEGGYALEEIPPGGLGVLVVTAAGFYEARVPLDTDISRAIPIVVSAAGVPRIGTVEALDPETEGVVVMLALEQGGASEGDVMQGVRLEGVSIGLQPGAGDGPYYLAEPGLYSPIAPATFGEGVGVILNLPAGDYVARFEHPWGVCRPGNGLEVDDEMAFGFRVEAGSETLLVAQCDVDVPEVATIIGRLVNGLSLPDPLDGGTVCLLEKNAVTGEFEEKQCATADVNGDYELSEVPANTEIRLRSSSPGYDNNDYVLNSNAGLTHESRLTPSVMKSYLWEPIQDAGKCPPIDNFETYDGNAFFTTRAFDAAYNSDTFHQGLWAHRAKLHIERMDGEGDPLNVMYFDSYIVNVSLDESTSNNGGIMTCAIPPGLHRIRYTHPWGECTIGYGNTPEPDGSFVVELLPANMLSTGGSCALTPPGTLVEELSTFAPVASMHQALTSAGLLGELVHALPPEVLYQSQRVTVLAPSEAAFSTYTQQGGMAADAATLASVLRHHLILGELEADELVRDEAHWTMAGKPIRFVEAADGTISVEGTSAKLIELEHWALDGNIYVLDEVLALPEGAEGGVARINVASDAASAIGGFQLNVETWESGLVNFPEVSVYTPPDYYPDFPGGYPVVYLLNDVGGDDQSLFGGPTMGVTPVSGLHQVVETLVGSEALPPLILVGVNGMSQGYGSYYTHSTLEGGTTAFGDFQAYLKAIMTQVEGTYNTATSPDSPAKRALMGIGMGGFGAVHFASEHPVFSAVIVHSGLLSVSDLLAPDPVVAASYPQGEVDGSLWSEVMAAWQSTMGTDVLDGRLVDLVGPGQSAISRVVSMATAFSPLKGLFTEFEMAGTTAVGRAAELVTNIDGNPLNNRDYPMVVVDTKGSADVTFHEYLGFRLPWAADGTMDEEVWALWAAHEPILAVQAAAEALKEADTDFYLDCAQLDERGLADQTEAFFLEAAGVLGAEHLTFELYQGDHDSALYSERFYTSMLWLADLLNEESEGGAP